MSTSSPLTIVVVDDEKSYTDVLAHVLGETFDAPVLCFNRPIAALDALAQVQAGVLVTDYFMPQMNGLDFLAAAARISPGTPAIMITGQNDAFEDARVATLPALKEVLSKPLSPRSVAAMIRKHCPAINTHPPREYSA